ncbi:hypothetical protein SAMN05216483_6516 [Streptomyces sp. 2131.1]|nr:hypothetical protein SAMN05216483_6516 [Streptomyces sp. 2131.1]
MTKLIATVLFTTAFVLGTAMAAPSDLTDSAAHFVKDEVP